MNKLNDHTLYMIMIEQISLHYSIANLLYINVYVEETISLEFTIIIMSSSQIKFHMLDVTHIYLN
jgi:hypothetical protein